MGQADVEADNLVNFTKAMICGLHRWRTVNICCTINI
jgi:hypothetical protein